MKIAKNEETDLHTNTVYDVVRIDVLKQLQEGMYISACNEIYQLSWNRYGYSCTQNFNVSADVSTHKLQQH